MHGPDLNNIVTLFGKEKCLHRLDNVGAFNKIIFIVIERALITVVMGAFYVY